MSNRQTEQEGPRAGKFQLPGGTLPWHRQQWYPSSTFYNCFDNCTKMHSKRKILQPNQLYISLRKYSGGFCLFN